VASIPLPISPLKVAIGWAKAAHEGAATLRDGIEATTARGCKGPNAGSERHARGEHASGQHHDPADLAADYFANPLERALYAIKDAFEKVPNAGK